LSICFNYKAYDAKDLCAKLHESNQLLVSYGSFKGEQFVRLVTINPENKKEEILNFFKILEKFVAENKEDHNRMDKMGYKHLDELTDAEKQLVMEKKKEMEAGGKFEQEMEEGGKYEQKMAMGGKYEQFKRLMGID